MKISYRTHPVLEKIYSNSLKTISYYEEDKDFVPEHLTDLQDGFKQISKKIKPKKIFILQKPFIEAYETAGDKLFKSNLWRDIKTDTMCLILPSGEATLLEIREGQPGKAGGGLVMCRVCGFQDNVITYFGILIMNIYIGGMTYSFNGWHSNNLKSVDQHIVNCVLINLFIKYAEVDTKFLPANKKVEDITCKYVNETALPVTILNSTWFTNLVKSDAFKVRGHFRLQPKKKNGDWTKELIWINEFQKDGYTRKAGILQND
jgi:hypothetical protein